MARRASLAEPKLPEARLQPLPQAMAPALPLMAWPVLWPRPRPRQALQARAQAPALVLELWAWQAWLRE